MSAAAPGSLAPEVVAAVRRSVRGVLEQSPGFQDSSPEQRRALAHKLVRVALAGAKLVQDDVAAEQRVDAVTARAAAADESAPLAEAASMVSDRADDLRERAERRAQDGPGPGSDYKAGVPANFNAAAAAGKTFQDLKNAIDFPTYVSSLISGVFRAITESSIKQIEGLLDLLDHVGSPAEEFAATEINEDAAAVWAIQRFSFLTAAEGGLNVRDGADIDDHKDEMKRALAATDEEVSAIDSSDLAGTLLPLVRRKLGKDRQSMLATLIQLGLQRVVVDDGKLHASMDMRVDTRSALQRNVQDRQDLGIKARASASMAGLGWGAKASFGTDFASVHSDNQLTKEEVDTRAGLRSTVDLAFRTEQIPLDRLADKEARVKLDKIARVPSDVSANSILDTSAPVGEVKQSGTLKDMKEMEPPTVQPNLNIGPGAKKDAEKKEPARKDDAKKAVAAKKDVAKKDAAKKDAAPAAPPAPAARTPPAPAPASPPASGNPPAGNPPSGGTP